MEFTRSEYICPEGLHHIFLRGTMSLTDTMPVFPGYRLWRVNITRWLSSDDYEFEADFHQMRLNIGIPANPFTAVTPANPNSL